jgi:tetratricopeptide (TPR) repeat protein
VSSTRRALARVHPELPPQAAVRYWNQQRLAEVGFQDHAALRVWYGDSTLIWTRFGGTAGLAQQVDALVEYVDRSPDPAFAIEPAAVDFFLSGARTFQAQRYREADTLFARGLEATTTRGPMYVTLLLNRARSHLAVGELDAAMAFNDQALRAGGEAPDYYAIQARIFAVSGRREEAVRAVERILRMEPENREGLELAQRLGMTGP